MEQVVDVACGSGDAQTLCITTSQEGANTVWSWGDGDYGKLGRGASDGLVLEKYKIGLKMEGGHFKYTFETF